MSEIEDDVAFALEQSAPAEVLGTLYSTAVDGDLYPMAEAAIAAAEPHFRRKHRQELYDELAAKAERSFESYLDGNFYISRDEWYQDVSAWLMVQKRKEAE